MAKTTKKVDEAEAEAPAKKAPAKKAATAKAEPGSVKAAGGRTAGLMKPMTPSKELAAVVGKGPLPRTEAVAKVWEYIKKHKLQNPDNGREILADDKLKAVFDVDKVTMFEMNKHLSRHLS